MQLTSASLKQKKQLTSDIIELKFETGNIFEFTAGQFLTIKIDDGLPSPCFRAYSISSSPQKNNHFEICVKVIPNGRGSNWLNTLKTTDKIEFIGPTGTFAFKTPKEKSILFIATGTGIAPLKSMLEDELVNKKNEQQIHLLFGVRHIKNIFYKDFFENLAKNHKNFTFDLTLSQPENENWQGNTGRVTNYLEKLKIDSQKTEVYACGLKEMIESVTEILHQKNLPKTSIHQEQYN